MRYLLLLACLVGCDSPSLTSDAGAVDARGPDLDDLLDRAAENYCQQAFDCCAAGAERDRALEIFGDPKPASAEECRTSLVIFLRVEFAPFRSAMAGGRILYDPSIAAACLRELERRSCDHYGGIQAALGDATCGTMFQGQVPLGQPCDFEWECADGNFCDTTCVPLPQLGQACGTTVCARGLFCNAGTCVRLLQDGEPCGMSEQCGSAYCDGVCGPPVGICLPVEG